MPRYTHLTVFALLVVVMASMACTAAPAPAPAPKVTTDTPAAAFRSSLNHLLSEHVYLAVGATGAALDGRDTEFTAAMAGLEQNAIGLQKAIASVYGDAAGEAFTLGWRRHLDFFVAYTKAVATKDAAKQAQAKADLAQYSQELAAFLNAANGLPVEAVVGLMKPHHVGMTAIIDLQAAGKDDEALVGTREAASHMLMIGDAVAEATVLKFPGKFAGDHVVAHR